jgi:hypothetical protein
MIATAKELEHDETSVRHRNVVVGRLGVCYGRPLVPVRTVLVIMEPRPGRVWEVL